MERTITKTEANVLITALIETLQRYAVDVPSGQMKSLSIDIKVGDTLLGSSMAIDYTKA